MEKRANHDLSTCHKEKLTAKQRQLVSNNLGLIGVHIKRFVHSLRFPHCDREWDDLFQEGCLGLIDAAKRFGPVSDMTFPTFALPRIRNAVNKALNNNYNMIYVPQKQRLKKFHDNVFHIPIPEMTYINNDEAIAEMPTSPSLIAPIQTIGDHVRERYESAVYKASESMMRQKTTRGDRRLLIETIIEHRMLIPDKENKTALRQIARNTQSSYGRVAQCEKQFNKMVREVLDADPEFLAMKRYAKTTPLGLDNPVDEALNESLRQASSEEMLRRYRKADPAGKASLLWRVMESNSEQTERMLHDRFTQLEPQTRRAIIDDDQKYQAKNTFKTKYFQTNRIKQEKNHTPSRAI